MASMVNEITAWLSHFISNNEKSDQACPKTCSNYDIMWLDKNINIQNDHDFKNSISHLKKLNMDIYLFSDENDCLKMVNDASRSKKPILIVSGSVGEHLFINNDKRRLPDRVFIFCRDINRHKHWARNYTQIHGVHNDIRQVCEAIQCSTEKCEQSNQAFGYIPKENELNGTNLDQIDQSFMYTQILKEILLSIEFDSNAINAFLTDCRKKFADNPIELNNIAKLEREYYQQSPIFWYTYDCFLYSMLNQALRLMEVDTIIKMGFFLRDLHGKIAALHHEQQLDSSGERQNHLTVYRGQCLSLADFERLKKTEDGLLSFNSFMSTSKSERVSLKFAKKALMKNDCIGIIFVIDINPTIRTTPFACISGISNFQSEREILFSMHSVFRVGSIQQREPGNNRLWQVKLTLTADNDVQREKLAKLMLSETQGSCGWYRLGRLFIMIGQYAKAEELYHTLSQQCNDKNEIADYYHHIGALKVTQGDYHAAIHYYQKALEINKNCLHISDEKLASSHVGLALAYSHIGYFKESLDMLTLARDGFTKIKSSNKIQLAITYGHIGRVHLKQGNFDEALFSHELALNTFIEMLPKNHPNIATCYDDLGRVYGDMSNLDIAKDFYEKALAIRTSVLAPNHPSIATSYNNLGEIYIKNGNFLTGIRMIEEAIDIAKRSLPQNHPDLKIYHSNLIKYNDLFDVEQHSIF